MTIPNSLKKYIKASIFLFFLSAFYAWLIRLSAITSLPFLDYAKVIQAHSHVAFLGWCYIATTLLMNWHFLPVDKAFQLKYKLFFGIQLALISLMLISFPLQGYKSFSIALLTAYVIISYFHCYWFLKDFAQTEPNKEVSLFVKSSVFYYILSTVGIWAIGPVLVTQGKGDMYFNTIYFYLHFLYNGFFIFVLFGLIFHLWAKQNITIPTPYLRNFFWLIHLACIPTYALSLISSKQAFYILTIGFLGALLQVGSLFYLNLIRKSANKSLGSSQLSKLLLSLITLAYFIKIMLQMGSAFPQISEQIVSLKSYFVIGYIHLVTLGIISSSLLFLLIELKVIKLHSKLASIALRLFIAGVLGTELLLFLQGSLLWFWNNPLTIYFELLLVFSTILILGIALIFISLWQK